MSHVTTSFGNFTVQSVDFIVPGGANIASSVGSEIQLTLVPDTGFELDYNDFSDIQPYPPQVDVVEFAQDGPNVIATLTLEPGATMPMNDFVIPVCFQGRAEEIGVGISGDIVTTISDVTITPAALTYSNTGPTDTVESIITKTIEPVGTGKYFPNTPTLSIDEVQFPNNYNITSTETYTTVHNIQRLTRVVFNVDYTYPDINVSGDSLNLVASAIDIPILVQEITGYSLNTNSINQAGETRSISILGTQGSEFSLQIILPTASAEQPTFSDGTNELIGTIGPSGTFTDSITFPSIVGLMTSQDYQFELNAEGSSSLNLQQPNPIDISQTTNVTYTVNVNSTEYTVTSRNNSFTFPANSDQDFPESALQLTFTITAPSGTQFTNTSTVVSTDWTFDDGGDTTTTEPTILSVLTINPDLSSITMSVGANVDLIGAQNFSSTINIDSFITSDDTPTCQSYELEPSGGAEATFSYLDCNDIQQTLTVQSGSPVSICAGNVPTITAGDGTIALLGACSNSAVGYNITSSNNSSTLACGAAETINDQIYIPNEQIYAGQTVYSLPTIVPGNAYNGGNAFYRILDKIDGNQGIQTGRWIYINTNGVVTSTGICSFGPSGGNGNGVGGPITISDEQS